MPLAISSGRPTICVRRDAFERAGVTRAAVDAEFSLTPDEFGVESALIVVGPLANEDMLVPLTTWLEARGLTYYDDFFELSGNWPEWLRLYAMATDR